MGEHTFKYALLPHGGILQKAGLQEQGLIREAYNFNVPLLVQSLPSSLGQKEASFFQVDQNAMVIDTVKRAEDNPRELIVRLYESHGGKCQFRFSSTLSVTSVELCNMLERSTGQPLKWENGGVNLAVSAFQIINLKLKF